MASVLHQKQIKFAHMVTLLIQHAFACGYEVTLGAALRIGDKRLHGKSLAIDLNLFKQGAYLTKTEDHAFLGAFWKSLDPLNCWGGDFKTNPDGNHYSLTHGGLK